ncbi:UNVERIFIED_CONTAM: hypothetical protein FKN15_067773 [Acipenser sinensis]
MGTNYMEAISPAERLAICLRDRRAQDVAWQRSSQPGQEGLRLVAFGVHKDLTWRDLYEATNKEKRLASSQPRASQPSPTPVLSPLVSIRRMRPNMPKVVPCALSAQGMSKRQPGLPAFWEEITDAELVAICDIAPPSTSTSSAWPAVWHNKHQKGQEHAVLQWVEPPSASAVDPEPYPQPHPAATRGHDLRTPAACLSMPPNTAGQAKQRKCPGATAQTAVLEHSAIPAPHPTSFHLFSC